MMRKAFLYIHLWTGLVAAIFLFLLGASGAIVAFEDELDRSLNPKLSYVQPQSEPLSIDAITQKLLARYPGSKIDGLEPPQRADLSMFVGLTDASGKRLGLLVDPYSGEVLGDAERGNRFVAQVHQFHTHFLAGEVGKQIVGWSGVLLLMLSISGIVLWWRAKIFRLRTGSAKRFNFELHNTLGVLSSVFLFIFAWTAICIHWQQPMGRLAQKMSPAPTVQPATPEIPKAGAAPLSPDRLIAIAHQTLPEAKIMRLQMPGRPKQPVSLSLKFPEDHTPIGRTRMTIDAYSGKVLYVQSSREMSSPMKYAQMWNREIHTGDILGMPTRILAAFFSLILPLLAITGPLIWWNRRRTAARPRASVSVPERGFAASVDN
jgi:uncharacterized iron-regulated membrane protein